MKIDSVNIQMEKGQEILLSFASPITAKQAMNKAKDTILTECSRNVSKVVANPPEHGKNLFTAYNGFQILGWITLNEK